MRDSLQEHMVGVRTLCALWPLHIVTVHFTKYHSSNILSRTVFMLIVGKWACHYSIISEVGTYIINDLFEDDIVPIDDDSDKEN